MKESRDATRRGVVVLLLRGGRARPFARALAPLGLLLEHLRKEGRIRPITLRALFFLIAHGATAPFTLAPLGRHFDNTDPLDPSQIAEQAALTADLITSGLRRDSPGR